MVLRHMNKPAAALGMTATQRKALESIARSQAAPHRLVMRSKALLLAADGTANTQIAGQIGGVAADRAGLAGALQRRRNARVR